MAPPAAAAGGTTFLLTATAWWVAKQNSGGNLTDQGSNGLTLTGVGTPNFTNDGSLHYCELRLADTDYFEIADNLFLDPVAGTFTAVVVATPRVNLTGTKHLICKRQAAGDGWRLYTNAAAATADLDVTSTVTSVGANLSVGTRATVALIINGASSFIVVNGAAGTTVTTPGSMNNTNEFRINRGSGTSTNYGDQDFFGCAIFKGTALTAAETVDVGNELIAASAV